MQILHSYKHDDALRKSFNELAGKSFGISFEDWYQKGYWNDFYDPYSIVEDGRVIANVSVNFTDMEYKGELLHLIQLGTVMTDPEYRKQGHSRMLIEMILKEYESRCDGFLLFANDTVLDFYPKFGFTRYDEYRCRPDPLSSDRCEAVKISMDSMQDQSRMFMVLNRYSRQGVFNQIGNADLNMYYLIQSMKDCVYYIPSLDAYAVAEVGGGTLILQEVFAKQDVRMEEVIRAFGKAAGNVILGFIPKDDTIEYETEKYHEDDTTLFLQGRVEAVIGKDKFKIPVLSHA